MTDGITKAMLSVIAGLGMLCAVIYQRDAVLGLFRFLVEKFIEIVRAIAA